MPETLLQQKKFYLIQLLRGIACILVVLMHMTINFSEIFNHDLLFNIFRFGISGVDIFFVISGFIITYTNLNCLNEPRAIGDYVKKRAIRIYPIYWILITLILIPQLLLPAFYKTQYVVSVANLLSTYLLLPGHIMINGVSWTLTNELFFYFIFIAAFLLPQKKQIVYLLCGYFVFLLFAGIFGITSTGGYLDLFVFPMNIEFLLGAFAVLLINKFPAKRGTAFFAIGIIWLLLAAFVVDKDIALLPGNYSRVLLFGMPAFLIILAASRYELTTKVKLPELFTMLGDASYSIYLIHLPVIVAFYKIAARLNIKQYPLLLLLSGLLFAGVCYLGIIIYQRIEKPLIKKLNRAFVKQ